jgi:hypothetical protein
MVLALLLSEANAILTLAKQSGDAVLVSLIAQAIDVARELHHQAEADEIDQPPPNTAIN